MMRGQKFLVAAATLACLPLAPLALRGLGERLLAATTSEPRRCRPAPVTPVAPPRPRSAPRDQPTASTAA
ncbi:MAG TPA: hypothetical protein VGM60_24310 [Pseudonocardia sp.]|uniref:hypothetical protein n=1 Tax=Pseudonocardia sp. TaxID=60912 RepID=UPI002F40DCBD